MTERRPLNPGDRLVVKVGSSSLSLEGGGIDVDAIDRVTEQVCEQRTAGHPTVLVTSGAVAAGSPIIGGRPTDLAGFQAAAAVGQVRLMEHYGRAFSDRGVVAGQVLLTKDILANRAQYLHARTALDRMLEMGVVPIVNENDTVAVEELRLGDNDRLAALVSHLVGAQLLILLTDTHGIYRDDPRQVDNAQLIDAVRHNDEVLDSVVSTSTGPLGSGGVATKIAAARMAAWSGVPTVIALAVEDGVVRRVVAGEDIGTLITPRPTGLSARKLWIAFGQPAAGHIHIDAGAASALTTNGASLLAVGVVRCEGSFVEGDAVEVYDPAGRFVAKGVVGTSRDELDRLKGERSSDVGAKAAVAVHRDQLVVFAS